MFDVAGLHKTYDRSAQAVHVLKGLDFRCAAGEFIGIFGASGSGKSTFLHILGGLDRPDEGFVKFDGADIYKKGDGDISRYRNREIGFVFQFYHLLPEFTALENVAIPCLIAGIKRSEALKMAESALAAADMMERLHHRPSELSGGEQQRVSIARAIVMRPRFILADEPTGNLDEATGLNIFSCLAGLHEKSGTGIIMVTHNPEFIKKIQRRFELKGGVLHAA